MLVGRPGLPFRAPFAVEGVTRVKLRCKVNEVTSVRCIPLFAFVVYFQCRRVTDASRCAECLVPRCIPFGKKGLADFYSSIHVDVYVATCEWVSVSSRQHLAMPIKFCPMRDGQPSGMLPSPGRPVPPAVPAESARRRAREKT